MLGIEPAVRTGRQQDDTRRFVERRADGLQARLPDIDGGLQAMDGGVAESFGEAARDDRAETQGVTDAAGSLRTIGQDAPGSRWRAYEIARVKVQGRRVARRHKTQGAQKAWIVENEIRRQKSFMDEFLRAVNIGEHKIEQTGALHDALRKGAPLRFGKDQGKQIHRPDGLIGVAALGQELIGRRQVRGGAGLLLTHDLCRHAPKRRGDLAPMRADGLLARDHFVVGRRLGDGGPGRRREAVRSAHASTVE